MPIHRNVYTVIALVVTQVSCGTTGAGADASRAKAVVYTPVPATTEAVAAAAAAPDQPEPSASRAPQENKAVVVRGTDRVIAPAAATPGVHGADSTF